MAAEHVLGVIGGDIVTHGISWISLDQFITWWRCQTHSENRNDSWVCMGLAEGEDVTHGMFHVRHGACIIQHSCHSEESYADLHNSSWTTSFPREGTVLKLNPKNRMNQDDS